MAPETIVAIEKIMAYCHDKWAEADRPSSSDWPPPDMQTGRKMAYNDVLQHARKLLSEG